MKKINFLFLMVIMVAATATVFAQTNNVPGGGGGAGLPITKEDLWTYAISALSPIIVWLVAKFMPFVPKQFLPVISPFVGILLGLALNKLGQTNLGWVDMAKAGALAVFVRESINQWITQPAQAKAAAAASGG